MKVKRQKHVRKNILFYKNNFGVIPPYCVLLDGTFCKAALKFKINISEQMPKYLEAEVRLCTTTCVKAECEALGSLLYGPLKVLQQFQVEGCAHNPPVPAVRCLHSLIAKGNKHKRMVATQDQELSDIVRSRPGVPLLFIAFNAITMEAPSIRSKKVADRTVESKLAPSEHAQAVLKQMKLEAFGEEVVVKKKKKYPKGPNPLSCKKKKKIKDSAVTQRKARHRKRKRVKVSGEVKEHLKQTVQDSKS